MTRAKELLDAATPLPWTVGTGGQTIEATRPYHGLVDIAKAATYDAALIVYAVNTLPAYEAAVEGLERIGECDRTHVSGLTHCGDDHHDVAREALRRLQEQTQ